MLIFCKKDTDIRKIKAAMELIGGDISKIKGVMELKGIFSGATYVCLLTYQISIF